MKDEAGMRRENCREGSGDQTAIQQQAQPCQTNSFHETICWPFPGTPCRRANPSWACSTWRGRASRCTPSSWPALPKQTCDTNSKNHCTRSKIPRQLINIKPEPPGPRLSLSGWLRELEGHDLAFVRELGWHYLAIVKELGGHFLAGAFLRCYTANMVQDRAN